LPQIVTHARVAFRQLRPELRAEMVQEVVCNAMQAFVRLKKTDSQPAGHDTQILRHRKHATVGVPAEDENLALAASSRKSPAEMNGG